MINYERSGRRRPATRHKKLLTAVFDSDVKRFAPIKNIGAILRADEQSMPKKAPLSHQRHRLR
jgi:hypothetical protein